MVDRGIVKARVIFCPVYAHSDGNPVEVYLYKDGTVKLKGKDIYKRGTLVLHKTQVDALIRTLKPKTVRKKK